MTNTPFMPGADLGILRGERGRFWAGILQGGEGEGEGEGPQEFLYTDKQPPPIPLGVSSLLACIMSL